MPECHDFATLRELLKPLAKRIAVAFIYGSVARQEDTARSDVDVMVVGDVRFSDVVLALSGAQERLRREINPSAYSKAELRAKLKEKVGFVDRVMGGTKLFLIGNDDDLRQLVENRKVETSPATRDEVVRLLASADTAVRDARLAGMSTTSRLDLA